MRALTSSLRAPLDLSHRSGHVAVGRRREEPFDAGQQLRQAGFGIIREQQVVQAAPDPVGGVAQRVGVHPTVQGQQAAEPGQPEAPAELDGGDVPGQDHHQRPVLGGRAGLQDTPGGNVDRVRDLDVQGAGVAAQIRFAGEGSTAAHRRSRDRQAQADGRFEVGREIRDPKIAAVLREAEPSDETDSLERHPHRADRRGQAGGGLEAQLTVVRSQPDAHVGERDSAQGQLEREGRVQAGAATKSQSGAARPDQTQIEGRPKPLRRKQTAHEPVRITSGQHQRPVGGVGRDLEALLGELEISGGHHRHGAELEPGTGRRPEPERGRACDGDSLQGELRARTVDRAGRRRERQAVGSDDEGGQGAVGGQADGPVAASLGPGRRAVQRHDQPAHATRVFGRRGQDRNAQPHRGRCTAVRRKPGQGQGELRKVAAIERRQVGRRGWWRRFRVVSGRLRRPRGRLSLADVRLATRRQRWNRGSGWIQQPDG